jgi:predicted lipid carrier protein YhbT
VASDHEGKAADCDKALRSLVDLLARVPAEVRSRYVLDRTVSCRVLDLGMTWSARLTDEGIVDLRCEDSADEAAKAQVRVSVGSDDLLALIEGRLSIATALATGRVRVQASPLDMLRLTSLI